MITSIAPRGVLSIVDKNMSQTRQKYNTKTKKNQKGILSISSCNWWKICASGTFRCQKMDINFVLSEYLTMTLSNSQQGASRWDFEEDEVKSEDAGRKQHQQKGKGNCEGCKRRVDG